MNHKYIVHDNCTEEHCGICHGGLLVCGVCGCAAGRLASECPGYDCRAKHGDAIHSGKKDFRGGRWVEL